MNPVKTPRRVPAGRRRGHRAPIWSGAALMVTAACGGGERQELPAYLRVEETARYGSVQHEGAAFLSISDVAVSDSAIFVLDAEPPRVAVLGHDGAWLRPIPAEGWRDEYLRTLQRDQIEQSGSVDRDFIDGIGAALAERRFYPSVTAVEAGSDGSVWIRREEVPGDSVRWEAFTRAGELHGSIRMPADVELRLVSLDEIWAVEKDALDVPFLVRMRVGP